MSNILLCLYFHLINWLLSEVSKIGYSYSIIVGSSQESQVLVELSSFIPFVCCIHLYTINKKRIKRSCINELKNVNSDIIKNETKISLCVKIPQRVLVEGNILNLYSLNSEWNTQTWYEIIGEDNKNWEQAELLNWLIVIVCYYLILVNN